MINPTSSPPQPPPLSSAQPPAGSRRRRLLLRIALVILALLLAAALAFVVWALWIPAPLPDALAALESGPTVAVSGSNPIEFAPTDPSPTCGFIFYPGARVDPRAYAAPLRAVAEAGYLVLAPSMPLNLAILQPQRAASLMQAHPEIERWVIGGHSLGAAMAISFAGGSPESVAGVALWAGFPAGSVSLAGAPLEVASIYGTLDGLATPEEVRAAAPQLPAGARFVPIEGGNHAQFGSYGDQRGDNPAAIARADQQAQAVAATVDLLAAACAGE